MTAHNLEVPLRELLAGLEYAGGEGSKGRGVRVRNLWGTHDADKGYWSEVSDEDRRRYEGYRHRVAELEAKEAQLLAELRGREGVESPTRTRELRRVQHNLVMSKIGAEEIRKAGHRQLVQDLRAHTPAREDTREVEEARAAARTRAVEEEARRMEDNARLRERVRESLIERERVRIEMGVEAGADVKRLRKAAGITQEFLSFLSGISVTTIGTAERGDAETEHRTLQSLAVGLALAEKKKVIIY
jgi:DNA-binding XRE family transcriptional regulator